MAKFLTELHVVPGYDDGEWILCEPLIYESDIAGQITVPVGFTTDFATVPRLPIVFSIYGDRVHRESVIHDYLCRIGCFPNVPYKTASDVFLEAMKVRITARLVKPEQSLIMKIKNKALVYAIAYPMYWGTLAGCWPLWKRRPVEEPPDYRAG